MISLTYPSTHPQTNRSKEAETHGGKQELNKSFTEGEAKGANERLVTDHDRHRRHNGQTQSADCS